MVAMPHTDWFPQDVKELVKVIGEVHAEPVSVTFALEMNLRGRGSMQYVSEEDVFSHGCKLLPFTSRTEVK